MKSCFYTLGAFFLLISTISCVPVRQLTYFNDIKDLEEPGINPKNQKLIMPFDKLYIKVFSVDLQTNQIFNSAEELRSGSNGGNDILGYLVNEKGNIYFPFVGDINVVSLTTSQAASKIQKALSDYVPNISVVVKYIDNHITVIGEVEHQGVYPFTQEKLNIYEALGLGGGITRYGDRKNIILVRHEGEKIMHYRLNLSNSKIATRGYYYILPNDVIIVEPMSAISYSYTNNTYLTILSSITTFIAVLLFAGLSFK